MGRTIDTPRRDGRTCVCERVRSDNGSEEKTWSVGNLYWHLAGTKDLVVYKYLTNTLDSAYVGERHVYIHGTPHVTLEVSLSSS